MTILKIDTSKIGFGNYCSPQTFGYWNSTNLSIVSIAAIDAVGTRCHIALICGLVKLRERLLLTISSKNRGWNPTDITSCSVSILVIFL
jgi:hypothetical protein